MTNTIYNYVENMTSDILDYIKENIDLADYEDREELEEYLNDTLWAEDAITGNASGSYYYNAWKAREALFGNMELLADALEAFGAEAEEYKRALTSPEYADVTIRCYCLGEAIGDALNEIYN